MLAQEPKSVLEHKKITKVMIVVLLRSMLYWQLYCLTDSNLTTIIEVMKGSFNMERTKKAFCPVCGKDLGSKQLDIFEHTVNLTCPRCH